jgi:hypothetical protein
MEGSGGYEYRNKDAKIRDQSDFHSERIPSPDAQAVVLDAVEIDLYDSLKQNPHAQINRA